MTIIARMDTGEGPLLIVGLSASTLKLLCESKGGLALIDPYEVGIDNETGMKVYILAGDTDEDIKADLIAIGQEHGLDINAR